MLSDEDALVLKRKIPIWRKDPARAVKEIWHVEPTGQQEKMLTKIFEPGSKVSVKSGHGTGKTTCFAWTIPIFLTCFMDAKIPVTAPSSAQLNDALWADLQMWHNKMPPQLRDLFTWTSDHFTCKDTGSFAVARTARKEAPEALQGFHAKELLFLIDEGSGIPEPIFQVAQGALSTPGARCAIASNPTRTNGYFYETFHKNRMFWDGLTFNGEDSPRVDRAFIQGIINEYGKDSDVYRVRVAGEFPEAGDMQFISRAIVEQAVQRKIYEESQYSFAPKIIGVDPAWTGGDEFVIYFRQGIYSKLLAHFRKNDDDVRSAELIAKFEDNYNADAVFIDQGYGTGLYSIGRKMNRNWELVAFGGSSSEPGYANKRAQMWGDMKDWLKLGGCIENDEILVNDLTGPEGYVTLKGDIILEKKEDMKKRGLASPNRADALAITFARPVRSKRETSLADALDGVKDEYDPLADY